MLSMELAPSLMFYAKEAHRASLIEVLFLAFAGNGAY